MTRKSELIRLELWIDPKQLAKIVQDALNLGPGDAIVAQEGVSEPRDEKNVGKVPVKAIFDLYKRCCPDLTQHTILTTAMQAAIRQRFAWVMKAKQFTDPEDALTWFKNFFTLVHATDFLCGRKNDGRDWKADLNWLMNEVNFDKILSGRY